VCCKPVWIIDSRGANQVPVNGHYSRKRCEFQSNTRYTKRKSIALFLKYRLELGKVHSNDQNKKQK